MASPPAKSGATKAAKPMPALTVASAPGKVLITGGYLVTERPNQAVQSVYDRRLLRAPNSIPISFISPQFLDSERLYSYSWTPRPTLSPDLGNAFVEITLLYVLALVQERIGLQKMTERAAEGLVISVLGDNGFYSQQQHLRNGTLRMYLLPKFKASGLPIERMKKTGLGSSAALTTALVSSLLVHFGVLDPQAAPDREVLHRVAQFCHCLAQNSIGSGFDVSAAVFGSQLYTRFSPSRLPLPSYEEGRKGVANAKALWRTLEAGAGWDAQHEAVRLPKGLKLLLGDVHEGSKTPGMVAAVQRWKSSLTPEALASSPWAALASLNPAIAGRFAQLCRMEGLKLYKDTLHGLATTPQANWRADGSEMSVLLADIREDFTRVRAALREMGVRSAAPGRQSFIEPPEQAALADATSSLPGVLIAGVPGAGGKDAIFAVVLGDAAGSRVVELWRSRSVVSLDVVDDERGVLIHAPEEVIPGHLLGQYHHGYKDSRAVQHRAKM